MRHGGERAVVAPVPAQPGQRDEDLLGVRDHARPAGLAQPGVADRRRRRGQQLVQRLAAGGRAARPPRRRPAPGRSAARRSARRTLAAVGAESVRSTIRPAYALTPDGPPARRGPPPHADVRAARSRARGHRGGGLGRRRCDGPLGCGAARSARLVRVVPVEALGRRSPTGEVGWPNSADCRGMAWVGSADGGWPNGGAECGAPAGGADCGAPTRRGVERRRRLRAGCPDWPARRVAAGLLGAGVAAGLARRRVAAGRRVPPAGRVAGLAAG